MPRKPSSGCGRPRWPTSRTCCRWRGRLEMNQMLGQILDAPADQVPPHLNAKETVEWLRTATVANQPYLLPLEGPSRDEPDARADPGRAGRPGSAAPECQGNRRVAADGHGGQPAVPAAAGGAVAR